MEALWRWVFTGLLGWVLIIVPPLGFCGFGERYCERDGFRCITVRPGDRWETLFPDPARRDVAERLNRRNTQPRPGQEIALPVESGDAKSLSLAPLETNIKPAPGNRLVIDQSELAWGAYDASGKLIRWGPMSRGKAYCPDVKRACRTLPGRFSIYRMQGAKCVSKYQSVGGPR